MSDFLTDENIMRVVTPMGSWHNRRAIIPPDNLRLSIEEHQVAHLKGQMVAELEARMLRSPEVEEVRWRVSHKHPVGVWAAVVVFWLLPMFEWLHDFMIRRDWWADSYAEAPFPQRRVLGLLAWAKDHWTVEREEFAKDVVVRWCPHVPIPEAYRDNTRNHVEWVVHGPEADTVRLAIAEHRAEDGARMRQYLNLWRLNASEFLTGPQRARVDQMTAEEIEHLMRSEHDGR